MSGTHAAQERRRIGELLLEAGVITPKQLDAALELKRERGGRLCYNLIRLGALRSDDLLQFLREQFGVAAVNLDRFRIDAKVMSLIPREYAVKEKVIPLHLIDERLTIAMADPGREEIIDEVREMTGREVDPLIAPEASIENALNSHYGRDPGLAAPGAEEGILTLGDEKEDRHLYQGEPPRKGYAAADWLKRFFLQAIKRRSRELHLEPGAWGLRSRYREGDRLVDGETAPPEMRRPITDAALALARIDGRSSSFSPLEGRLMIVVRARTLRAVLSSFPTLQGERLVFQIMDEALLGKGFQELGMSKETTDDLVRILNMRTGVVLVSAPPGQGKKTTFYNILSFLCEDRGKNVMTLEHPIQYPLPGVGQTQVTFSRGVDFYHGLRSLLGQNPDVVGLTDISDCRTLELVFSVARQCLVIGLCGFWESLQAMEWIESCRVGRAIQARYLRGLLVQRVLPRICSHCRERLEAPVDLVEGLRDKKSEDLVFYTGKGCARCGHTGRAGRLGMYELFALGPVLRDMVLRGADKQVLYEEAQRMGMLTLREDGIMKATQGLVDIRDVLESTREEGSED